MTMVMMNQAVLLILLLLKEKMRLRGIIMTSGRLRMRTLIQVKMYIELIMNQLNHRKRKKN
ncbi:hypothetical protein GLYMA_01G197200v4 [Glycine max]|nr:hypothetical protein GLYMA_01G197200v4 [Glycine max]KAH1163956.1 hypothetical protein GYH30_002139 [Glycine max]